MLVLCGMTANPAAAAPTASDHGRRPRFGEAIPWFTCRSLNGPAEYGINQAGGRPLLLLFFGTANHPLAQMALGRAHKRRDWFDDTNASFFGVTVDPTDAQVPRIGLELPGWRFLLDYDRKVSRLFGAAGEDGRYEPYWFLLDRHLRVVADYPIREADAALAHFRSLMDAPVAGDWAPVALVENVIEPELCRHLISQYEDSAPSESGVMREIEGKTKLVLDNSFKVRRDHVVTDPALSQQLIARLQTRLRPMVRRCFSFEATHIERLLVGCYDEADGGHFRAHRDDTTRGTAHRRFAVTINLNPDEYEGGDLVFPEFGQRRYRAPRGSAIVFSCSLLHQVTPVTKGRRFALLPFLFDEAAAKLREANMHLIDTDPLRVGAA